MSDYTQTPNFGLFKPTPDADDDLWGEHWNINADTLDAALQAQASGYLPLSAGIAHPLTGTLYTSADPAMSGVTLDLVATGAGANGWAYLFTSDQTGTNDSGQAGLGTGNTANGNTGPLFLYTGNSTAGSSGSLVVATGTAAGAGHASGALTIQTGATDGIATRGSLILDAPMASFTGALAVAGAVTLTGHLTNTWPITILWNDTAPSYAAFGFWDTHTNTGFGFFPYTSTVLAISVINSQGGATSPGFQFHTDTGVFSIPGSGGLHLANVNTDPSSVVGGIEMYPGFGGFGVTANTLNYNWTGTQQFLAGSTPIMSLGTGGQTMQLPLTLHADPTTALQAATKQYVDARVGGITEAPSDSFAYGRLNAAWARVLPLAGGTLGGSLFVGPATAGYLQLSPGNATNTGYVGFYNAAGVRQGYFGYAAAGSFALTIEDATHAFLISGANVGLNIPPPAGAAAAGASGGWLFGWGVTAANWGFNLYYGTDSAWHYRAAGAAVLTQSVGTGWTWMAAANGAADGVAAMTNKMSLDLSGNLNTVGGIAGTSIASTSGNVTAAGNVVSHGGVYVETAIANNYILYGDSGSLYHSYEAGYYWAWNRTSGALAWVGNGTTGLTIDASGNMTLHGNLAPRQGNSIFGTGGTGVILQMSPSWYWNWDINSGQMAWYCPNGGLWTMREGPDMLCYNASSGVAGYGPYADLSDERAKQEVSPATTGLAEILQLEPINFTRIGAAKVIHPPEIGFSAQQVRPVIPEAVRIVGIALPGGGGELDDDEPSLAITSTAIVAAMVNAIKELATRVVALEAAR